jgi:hypothetical protein
VISESDDKTDQDPEFTILGRMSRRRFVSLTLAAVGTFLAACRGALEPPTTSKSASGPATTPATLPTETLTKVPDTPTATSAPPSPTPMPSPYPEATTAGLPPTQEPTVVATTQPTATAVPATPTTPPTATALPTAPLTRDELMAHWPAIDKSRVVVVRHSGVWADGSPDPDRVLQMLDDGMRTLADNADARAIWQALFQPGERVLLKVNCIAYGGPTQPAVTYAVAQRLQDAGLRAEDILIFDRTDRELQSAGYTLNDGGAGIQCHGAKGEGSEAPLTQARVRFFREIDDYDAIINIPTPKQHSGAGVSVSLKNHYGSVNRPGRLHGNWCDPAIAELNAQDNIREKTRLIVGAALHVSPADWNRPKRENALMLSFDPVALDTVARDILVRQRESLGLDNRVLAEGARHLATAQSLGLGATDANHIALREVVLG